MIMSKRIYQLFLIKKVDALNNYEILDQKCVIHISEGNAIQKALLEWGKERDDVDENTRVMAHEIRYVDEPLFTDEF